MPELLEEERLLKTNKSSDYSLDQLQVDVSWVIGCTQALGSRIVHSNLVCSSFQHQPTLSSLLSAALLALFL